MEDDPLNSISLFGSSFFSSHLLPRLTHLLPSLPSLLSSKSLLLTSIPRRRQPERQRIQLERSSFVEEEGGKWVGRVA